MPIAAPRGVTSESLSSLMPVPMGIFEGPEGEGLLQLVRKLIKHPDVATKEGNIFVESGFPDWTENVLSTAQAEAERLGLKPGLHEIENSLFYIGPKGDVIGAAQTRGNAVPSFVVDKTKGLLAQKAAIEIGKKLLGKGTVAMEEGSSISKDTYNLLLKVMKKAR